MIASNQAISYGIKVKDSLLSHFDVLVYLLQRCSLSLRSLAIQKSLLGYLPAVDDSKHANQQDQTAYHLHRVDLFSITIVWNCVTYHHWKGCQHDQLTCLFVESDTRHHEWLRYGQRKSRIEESFENHWQIWWLAYPERIEYAWRDEIAQTHVKIGMDVSIFDEGSDSEQTVGPQKHHSYQRQPIETKVKWIQTDIIFEFGWSLIVGIHDFADQRLIDTANNAKDTQE